jgi:hypothetical protein
MRQHRVLSKAAAESPTCLGMTIGNMVRSLFAQAEALNENPQPDTLSLTVQTDRNGFYSVATEMKGSPK